MSTNFTTIIVIFSIIIVVIIMNTIGINVAVIYFILN